MMEGSESGSITLQKCKARVDSRNFIECLKKIYQKCEYCIAEREKRLRFATGIKMQSGFVYRYCVIECVILTRLSRRLILCVDGPAYSDDREKAWSSINHSVLSAVDCTVYVGEYTTVRTGLTGSTVSCVRSPSFSCLTWRRTWAAASRGKASPSGTSG